ncbi:hypothetical protein VTK73DRAFT_535 [Phialemonium thermophilum]|uniref:Uncharacterized protein n=1 Tax=Phialemonium thermophilum TaxID=223376 RepID=A0ABR3Y3Y0_9PEZI
MSARSSTSPRNGPVTAQVDESDMPHGPCRFILLLPEIRGQRCACVNFTLNKAIPAATCICGHLACFHKKEDEPSGMDELARRIKALEERRLVEDRVARENDDDAYQGVLHRLSAIEDDLERSKEELHQEVKRVWSNSTPLWGSYQQLRSQVRQLEELLRKAEDRLTKFDGVLQRLDDRQLELQDADAYLEERIENIVETIEEEDRRSRSWTRQNRPRHRSTPDTRRPSAQIGPLGVPFDVISWRRPSLEDNAGPGRRGFDGASMSAPAATQGPSEVPFLETPTLQRRLSEPSASGIWTVHISLMPHASIPMPFERNTNAYLRCLSRGLHQMVAVRGPSAEAFDAAVAKAFGQLLKGRPWMPLQAMLCDAGPLAGLPMLRQLEPSLLSATFDEAFLREKCAVCDTTGKMDSLYITMREPHALSWNTLRRSPVVVEGLEESWEYDPLLDKEPYDRGVAVVDDDDDRPAAGEIVPAALPSISLKRTASEMARSSSFGAVTVAAAPPLGVDGLASRTKRTCPATAANTVINIRRPGVGTA